jgi:hypothetical protein
VRVTSVDTSAVMKRGRYLASPMLVICSRGLGLSEKKSDVPS